MKTTKIILLTTLFLFFFGMQPIFAQEFVYVSAEKAELKDGTGVLAKTVTEVKYGKKLLVLENTIEDKWIKVADTKDETICGWILSSNVTKRKIVKFLDKQGSKNKEQALAGKGSSIEKSTSNKSNSLKKFN